MTTVNNENITSVPLDQTAWETPQESENTVSRGEYDLALNQLAEAQGELAKVGVEIPTDKAKNEEAAAREYAKRLRKAQADARENNPEGFAKLVSEELHRLQAREAAKKEHDLAKLDIDLSILENPMTLEDWLNEEDEDDDEWRVKNLMYQGHITTIAAPAKAGKSSFALNRLKSYADGTPLFGHFPVTQVQGNICYMNYELSAKQFKRWIRSIDIENRDKIIPLNLRGKEYFIQHRPVADALIDFLNANNVELLEIDPLQAAFIGQITSDEDAADWINALQRIVAKTGVKDVVVTTHTGHNRENRRSIGSARWVGFPDNLMLFERVEGEENITQLEIEQGRDITLDPIRLQFDPESRIMRYKGGAKDKVNLEDAKLRHRYVKALVDYEDEMVAFNGEDWIPANDLMKTITNGKRSDDDTLRSSLKVWIDLGMLEEETGPRRKKLVKFTEFGLKTFEDANAPEDLEHIIDGLVAMRLGETAIKF